MSEQFGFHKGGVDDVFWCRHCGYQSEELSEVQKHCFNHTSHNGISRSIKRDEVDNYADDAAARRLIVRKKHLNEYQLERLYWMLHDLKPEWFK